MIREDPHDDRIAGGAMTMLLDLQLERSKDAPLIVYLDCPGPDSDYEHISMESYKIPCKYYRGIYIIQRS